MEGALEYSLTFEKGKEVDHRLVPELAQHFEKLITFSNRNLGHSCRNTRVWTVYKWQSTERLGASWTPENIGWGPGGEPYQASTLKTYHTKTYAAKAQLLCHTFSMSRRKQTPSKRTAKGVAGSLETTARLESSAPLLRPANLKSSCIQQSYPSPKQGFSLCQHAE